MGRRRKTDTGLPARVYAHHGALFYVDRGGHWHRIGSKWDSEAKAEWLRITTGAAPDGTVAQLLDAFIEHCEAMVRAGKRAARTLTDNNAEAAMLKLVFGRMSYRELTSKHVATYLRRRVDRDGNPAPIRANREAAFLSSAFSWAMGDDRFDVQVNPCYGVRRNSEQPRRHYVDTRTVSRFGREFAPKWLRGYIMLKRLTAMREGDMLKLGRGNLESRGLRYVAGKTGEERLVRWSWALRVTVNWILALHGETPRLILFPSRTGGALTTSGFKSAWQRAMREFVAAGGARFWEHDIRAKTASDIEDEREAQKLLGHASAATTKRHYRRGVTKVSPLR